MNAAPVLRFPVIRYLLLLTVAFAAWLHIALLMPGVDAGIHMYGAYLVTAGKWPMEQLWNNKPPLIYLVGALGFFIPSNPFLGVRLVELAVLLLNLVLIHRIAVKANLRQPLLYPLTFLAIYLVCWDEGFLTETFTIPLNLLALYLFIAKAKWFEAQASLLFLLCTLLKQNGMFITGSIILIDIFSNYREGHTGTKLRRYACWLPLYAGMVALWFLLTGVWDEFVDQVYTYNYRFVPRPGWWQWLVAHVRHNSFLSVKGVSVVMLFNLALLWMLWQYASMRRAGASFTMADKLLAGCLIVYLATYGFVYTSGKTYAHYFLLLIVPATFLFGKMVSNHWTGKLALTGLLVYAVWWNLFAVSMHQPVHQYKKPLADYLAQHSSPEDRVYIEGAGNQYVYVLAGRRCHTRFVVPLSEPHGYTEERKNQLLFDFAKHTPQFIVLSKQGKIDADIFQVQLVRKFLYRYSRIWENDAYVVYRFHADAAVNPTR